MESLVKSLLGKGQEHVYETMQTMIEDAEKARSMEIELHESKMLLENLKDANEQNKKKIRDLKDDLDYERGINEELVDELKGKDDEIDHLKKCVKNRDDISTSLDDMFKEKLDEIRNRIRLLMNLKVI
jgi:gas vesicle protein